MLVYLLAQGKQWLLHLDQDLSSFLLSLDKCLSVLDLSFPLPESPALLWIRGKDGTVFGAGGNRHGRVLAAAAHDHLPRHGFGERALQFRREAQLLRRVTLHAQIEGGAGVVQNDRAFLQELARMLREGELGDAKLPEAT